jgi:hypothetical protein
MTDIERIRLEVREDMIPYFNDGEIEKFYEKNNGDVEKTIYELLIIKAEDSHIVLSGLTTDDTSSYFRRLASTHRRFNSGILPGG